MRGPDVVDPDLDREWERAAATDLESQLRASVARIVAEALARCPAAHGVIRAREKALYRRVTGLLKAQRELSRMGEKRAQQQRNGEDGSHGE